MEDRAAGTTTFACPLRALAGRGPVTTKETEGQGASDRREGPASSVPHKPGVLPGPGYPSGRAVWSLSSLPQHTALFCFLSTVTGRPYRTSHATRPAYRDGGGCCPLVTYHVPPRASVYTRHFTSPLH